MANNTGVGLRQKAEQNRLAGQRFYNDLGVNEGLTGVYNKTVKPFINNASQALDASKMAVGAGVDALLHGKNSLPFSQANKVILGGASIPTQSAVNNTVNSLKPSGNLSQQTIAKGNALLGNSTQSQQSPLSPGNMAFLSAMDAPYKFQTQIENNAEQLGFKPYQAGQSSIYAGGPVNAQGKNTSFGDQHFINQLASGQSGVGKTSLNPVKNSGLDPYTEFKSESLRPYDIQGNINGDSNFVSPPPPEYTLSTQYSSDVPDSNIDNYYPDRVLQQQHHNQLTTSDSPLQTNVVNNPSNQDNATVSKQEKTYQQATKPTKSRVQPQTFQANYQNNGVDYVAPQQNIVPQYQPYNKEATIALNQQRAAADNRPPQYPQGQEYQQAPIQSNATPDWHAQQEIQRQIAHDMRLTQRDMSDGSNRINAKYAQKNLETLLGNDVANQQIQQGTNKLGQDESQFRRNQDMQGWKGLLDNSNDQQRLGLQQQGLNLDTAKYGLMQQSQANENARTKAGLMSTPLKPQYFKLDNEEPILDDKGYPTDATRKQQVLYSPDTGKVINPMAMLAGNQQAAPQNILKQYQELLSHPEATPEERAHAIAQIQKIYAAQRQGK